MEEKIITAKEAAEILGVDRSSILRWVREGKLTYYKVGSRYRFTEQDIKDFIKKSNAEGE